MKYQVTIKPYTEIYVNEQGQEIHPTSVEKLHCSIYNTGKIIRKKVYSENEIAVKAKTKKELNINIHNEIFKNNIIDYDITY